MLQRKTSVAAGLKAALAVGASLWLASPLAGCGQKGPLVLPAAAASAAAVSAASPTSASASSASAPAR